MKIFKKVFKKISLVYTLQIFAVILIFGYTDSASKNEAKAAVTDGIMPLGFYKQSTIKTNKDSVLTGNINALWKVNPATAGN